MNDIKFLSGLKTAVAISFTSVGQGPYSTGNYFWELLGECLQSGVRIELRLFTRYEDSDVPGAPTFHLLHIHERGIFVVLNADDGRVYTVQTTYPLEAIKAALRAEGQVWIPA